MLGAPTAVGRAASSASRAGAASASTRVVAAASLPRGLAPLRPPPSASRHPGRRHARALLLRAAGGEDGPASSTTSATADSPPSGGGGDSLKSTLGALDALLGVEPEPPKEEEKVCLCVRVVCVWPSARRGRGRRVVLSLALAPDTRPSLSLHPHHAHPPPPKFPQQPDPASPQLDVSFSPEILSILAKAEAERAAGAGSSTSSSSSSEDKKDAAAKEMEGKLSAVVDAAKRAAAARSRSGSGDESKAEADLESAMASMLNSMAKNLMGGADRADLQKLKDEVFGPRVFWVTETQPVDPFLNEGWLIRGNLRTSRAAAFAAVKEGTARLFGDKYVVLMVEDPVDAMDALENGPPTNPDGSRPEPRIAFQVVTADAASPPDAPRWQPLAAAVLAALTAGSALQLGMAANISRLPPAVLEWLADPNGLAASGGVLPPFVEAFDPSAFIASALPLAGAVLGVQAVHEAGHAAVARARGIKTSLPLLVPNGQLGTFGGITQIRSLLPDRAALFDFAAAGPFAGGALSAVLFIVGLALSGGGGPVPDAATAADTALATTGGLLPVPAALLQGSLLLGGVAKAALGSGGITAAAGTAAVSGVAGLARAAAPVILVHPLVVVGWAGLVGTALNLLPVGRLDGGRMVQAAFGTTALGVSSFLTYVGLALGFLGSALALPFGLYVLICQRDPEAPPADGVSPPEGPRGVAAAVAIGLALLVLLPAAPEVVQSTSGGMFL
jgi:hypothetical protein